MRFKLRCPAIYCRERIAPRFPQIPVLMQFRRNQTALTLQGTNLWSGVAAIGSLLLFFVRRFTLAPFFRPICTNPNP